uniref:Uncharacterized protein n=1 Tax=viral metagenome TaxID=1070528 RepID=A0A6C0ASV6_9ZZZZ
MNNLGLDNWTLFGNDSKTASTPELIGDIIVGTAKTTFDPLRSPHLNHLKHAILSDNQPEFEKYKGNANSYNEDETLHTSPINIALRFGRCKWVSALLDNTDRLTKERLREIFLNAFYLSMTKPEYVLKEYFEKGKYKATEEERIRRARRDVINLFQGKQQEGDMLYSKTFKDLVPDSEIDNFIAKVKTGLNHSNLSCVKVILDRFKSLNPKPEEWKKLLSPFDGVKSGTFVDEMSYALRRAYDKQNIELCKYLCNEIYKDYPQIGEVIIPTNPKYKKDFYNELEREKTECNTFLINYLDKRYDKGLTDEEIEMGFREVPGTGGRKTKKSTKSKKYNKLSKSKKYNKSKKYHNRRTKRHYYTPLHM